MIFYKNKYLIGIYDEQDNLKYLFDNAKQMAMKLNVELSRIYSMLSAQFTGAVKCDTRFGIIKFIEFI